MFHELNFRPKPSERALLIHQQIKNNSSPGQPLGLFDNETAAAKAVYQHSDAARRDGGR